MNAQLPDDGTLRSRRTLLKLGLAVACALAVPMVASARGTAVVASAVKPARRRWRGGPPNTALLQPMVPPRWITVHHDGIDATSEHAALKAPDRIERIRLAHVRRGWGDIGYHYLIDRDGGVWEGRSLAYQGAHVQGANEANIGICCLGNFEVEHPSQRQLKALAALLARLSTQYGISPSHLRTHQEWSRARTACPGRNLQTAVVRIRCPVSPATVGSSKAISGSSGGFTLGSAGESEDRSPHTDRVLS